MTQTTKSIITKKIFNYSKRGVTLGFELTDDPQQIKDFRSLLNEAIKDIDMLLVELDK